MFRKFYTLVVLVVPVLCYGNEREEVGDNSVEAASVIASHYANVDAIQTFDVVYKYSSVLETPPDVEGELAFGSEDFTARCVCDPKNDRNFFLKKVSHEHVLSLESTASLDILSSAIGMEGRIYQRQFPHNVFASDLTKERPFEAYADVPGFRILTLSPFPAPGRRHPGIESARKDIQTPNATYRLVTNGKLHVVTKRSLGKEAWGETRLEIDAEKLVVLRVRVQRATRKGDEVERKLVFDERISWGELNDVLVPLSIEGQGFRQKVLGDGKSNRRVRVANEYSCELKWLSIGESLPEDKFPVSLLNDQKELATMADFESYKNKAEPIAVANE